jgi:hypothetical protein
MAFMTKICFVFFTFLILTFPAYAQLGLDGQPVLEKIEIHGDVGFGYDYSFGFAKVEGNKVLLEKTNYLALDDRFRNYIYIDHVNLLLKANLARVLTANISTAIVSNGLFQEPLYNPDSYRDFKVFLQDRRANIKNIWQRYLILQDINFVLKDETVDGNLVIGQHLIPFGYFNNNTLNPPIATNPLITPMSEYINFNLRAEDDTPYQNSTLTRLRDIGLTLTGNYSGFRFMAGVYNGAGPNSLDNNNYKDFFGRFDYIVPALGEVGISHWRGRHVGFKNVYAVNPGRDEFEMYRTGLHGRLGNDRIFLAGEVILSQDRWMDKTDVEQLGWYVEGTIKAEQIFSGTLRYESFADNNALKNVKRTSYYNLKRFVASLTQSFADSVGFREEYSHTWEDINETSGNKAFSNYGIASVNLLISF